MEHRKPLFITCSAPSSTPAWAWALAPAQECVSDPVGLPPSVRPGSQATTTPSPFCGPGQVKWQDQQIRFFPDV